MMTSSNESLPRTACITGAAIRVGRAIALHLAQQGWQIVIHYHTSCEQAERTLSDVRHYGVKATAIQADLSNANDVEKLIARVNDEMGVIHCLIHNASLFERQPFSELKPADLRAHLAINLEAPLLLSRDFAAQLPDAERGDIICLLDGMKDWSIAEPFLSYSLSKLGMQNAISLLKNALGPTIRINGIALGPTIKGAKDVHTFEKLRQISALQSTSCVQEVCRTLDYLLGSTNVTGEIISLASGFNTTH